ncbi:MAG TPA: hypothetical protein VF747_03490 [Blastocatellia bacterium]|jgi:hypothetical protein
MTKNESKRLEVIGARLDEFESSLWAEVLKRARRRNKLATDSAILRDFLFGDLGIVTEEDREYLRTSRATEDAPNIIVPVYNAVDENAAGKKNKKRNG